MPELICNVCDKKYHVPKYRKNSSKYCSRYCMNHGQYKSITKICKNCNKQFKVSNSRVHTKYCSFLCSHNGKHNLVTKRKQSKRASLVSRGASTSRTIRKFVFDNKPKICEICNYDEHDFCLDIHHIDENPLNNDINNLAVLCVMCHRKLHKGIIDYANKI